MITEKKVKIAIAIQRFFGTIALSSLAVDYKWVSTACIVVTAIASEYINFLSPSKTDLVNTKLKSTILILISIIVLSSCVTRKACMSKFPPQVVISDSSVVKYITKDSIIEIPGERITDTVEIQIECPGNGKPIIKSSASVKTKNKASILTRIDGNKIIAECICSSEKARIKWLEKELSSYHKEIIKDPPMIEFKTPWWNYLIMGAMSAIIIYLLARKLFT
jgi:hypothetical protein